ncbi:MAG: serine/threonine-protein kinase [Solirubrobacteraceae bacterium]
MTEELVIGGQLGNYLIESVIGRGGMSVVYRAKHARLGTSVALKVLAPELSSDDTFRERFLREAQMAAGIDHPNVIPIYDTGLHEGSLYIVMRYIPGGDLRALLSASGPLDAEQAIEFLMPVARALDAAHAHGLVHRDVKPGNILVQRSQGGEIEHVYLTDFGVAKSVTSVSGLTRAGGMIGTVEYMAPEQTQGREVSAATDVYGLASVFYQCITGRTPFERQLLAGAPAPTGPPEPVSAVRPELPAALDGVIAKGLARDPADRYGSCEQFLRACDYSLKTPSPAAEAVAGATVAETPLPGQETVAIGDEAAPAVSGSAGTPAGAGTGEASPPPPSAPPPPPVTTPPITTPPERTPGRGWGTRRTGYAVALLVAVAAVAVAVVLLASSSSSSAKPTTAALAQVPTNHATGSGTATVRLEGDVAKITVTTNGLDENEALVHPMHIHAGGKGECPPASAARPANGHLAISTTDGLLYYGDAVTALTTSGDTSPSSILALKRFPSGGDIRYSRTITLPAPVVADIRRNNAVVVVHGTDYDHSGSYSGVLERSELNKSLPATETAPALCGVLLRPRTTASAGPREPGHVIVYTASLADDPAALFACEALEATSAVAGTRRPSDAHRVAG